MVFSDFLRQKKTDRHGITEKLLKVALNTINLQTSYIYVFNKLEASIKIRTQADFIA